VQAHRPTPRYPDPVEGGTTERGGNTTRDPKRGLEFGRIWQSCIFVDDVGEMCWMGMLKVCRGCVGQAPACGRHQDSHILQTPVCTTVVFACSLHGDSNRSCSTLNLRWIPVHTVIPRRFHRPEGFCAVAKNQLKLGLISKSITSPRRV
jgi:hypothetical protein